MITCHTLRNFGPPLSLPRNLAKRLVAKPVPSEKKRPPISDTSDEEYQEKRPRKIAQNAVTTTLTKASKIVIQDKSSSEPGSVKQRSDDGSSSPVVRPIPVRRDAIVSPIEKVLPQESEKSEDPSDSDVPVKNRLQEAYDSLESYPFILRIGGKPQARIFSIEGHLLFCVVTDKIELVFLMNQSEEDRFDDYPDLFTADYAGTNLDEYSSAFLCGQDTARAYILKVFRTLHKKIFKDSVTLPDVLTMQDHLNWDAIPNIESYHGNVSDLERAAFWNSLQQSSFIISYTRRANVMAFPMQGMLFAVAITNKHKIVSVLSGEIFTQEFSHTDVNEYSSASVQGSNAITSYMAQVFETIKNKILLRDHHKGYCCESDDDSSDEKDQLITHEFDATRNANKAYALRTMTRKVAPKRNITDSTSETSPLKRFKASERRAASLYLDDTEKMDPVTVTVMGYLLENPDDCPPYYDEEQDSDIMDVEEEDAVTLSEREMLIKTFCDNGMTQEDAKQRADALLHDTEKKQESPCNPEPTGLAKENEQLKLRLDRVYEESVMMRDVTDLLSDERVKLMEENERLKAELAESKSTYDEMYSILLDREELFRRFPKTTEILKKYQDFGKIKHPDEYVWHLLKINHEILSE